jgi:hypothetical protein
MPRLRAPFPHACKRRWRAKSSRRRASSPPPTPQLRKLDRARAIGGLMDARGTFPNTGACERPRRAATYAGRTTCSTKYMRKRTSPPVSATDASAQSHASIARIRARTDAANATQTGTTTPTRTWPDPGPLPGGFGIEPPPRRQRSVRRPDRWGESDPWSELCVASASTLQASAPESGTQSDRPGLPTLAQINVSASAQSWSTVFRRGWWCRQADGRAWDGHVVLQEPGGHCVSCVLVCMTR